MKLEAQAFPGEWRSIEYYYAVLNSEEQEVLLYHWHPRGSSSVTTPHLHLKQGAQVGHPEVRGAHLPTGAVSLNAILRVLIAELSVRQLRPDWESICPSRAPTSRGSATNSPFSAGFREIHPHRIDVEPLFPGRMCLALFVLERTWSTTTTTILAALRQLLWPLGVWCNCRL